MTPQAWIEKYNNGFELSLDEVGPCMDECAQHLAAALEAVAAMEESKVRRLEISIVREDALREEIARLQAQLSQAQAERDRWHYERNALFSEVTAMRNSERVVVPELTEEDMKQVTGREYFNGFRTGYHLAADRLYSVPASRVLGDGEVAVSSVDCNAWLILEQYARKHAPESVQKVIEILDENREAINALRAQGKETTCQK